MIGKKSRFNGFDVIEGNSALLLLVATFADPVVWIALMRCSRSCARTFNAARYPQSRPLWLSGLFWFPEAATNETKKAMFLRDPQNAVISLVSDACSLCGGRDQPTKVYWGIRRRLCGTCLHGCTISCSAIHRTFYFSAAYDGLVLDHSCRYVLADMNRLCPPLIRAQAKLIQTELWIRGYMPRPTTKLHLQTLGELPPSLFHRRPDFAVASRRYLCFWLHRQFSHNHLLVRDNRAVNPACFILSPHHLFAMKDAIELRSTENSNGDLLFLLARPIFGCGECAKFPYANWKSLHTHFLLCHPAPLTLSAVFLGF